MSSRRGSVVPPEVNAHVGESAGNQPHKNDFRMDSVIYEKKDASDHAQSAVLPRQEDLYTAVRLNDKETVKEVLDSMKVAGATGRESDGELPTAFVAAINCPDANGRRALDYVATIDAVAIGKMLLDNGADPNLDDANGRPPLLWAAYHNRAKISKLLVERGADLRVVDSRGRGLLHLCSRIKDTQCFKLYLKLLNEKHPIHVDEEPGEERQKTGEPIKPVDWINFRDALAFHGSPEHCREMVKCKANPLAEDKEGKTPLHWLASSKKCDNPVATANVLVDAEIQANKKRLNTEAPHPYNHKSRKGYTPLHYSLMVGNELSHIILNNADTDVNMMDGQGRGALHCAVLAKKTEYVVSILQSLGKDKATEALALGDKSGWTPLHYAAHVGSCVPELFEHAEPAVDAEDEFQQTPLMLAAAAGHIEEAIVLCKHGAEIDRANGLGCSPIHIATFNNKVELIQMLCKHGADLNKPDVQLQDPLMIAAEHDLPECAEALCTEGQRAEGANVSAVDEKGRAAIHLAVKVGSLECVKILGDKYNAPLNLAANDGFTPLLVAVVAQPNHMSDIIDALLREGAEPNLTNDGKRRTPLHALLNMPEAEGAFSADQLRAAALLITAKADLKAVTTEDETPLDIAIRAGDPKMAELLRTLGGKTWQALEDAKVKAGTPVLKKKNFGGSLATATRATFRFRQGVKVKLPEVVAPREPPKPVKKRGITEADYAKLSKGVKGIRTATRRTSTHGFMFKPHTTAEEYNKLQLKKRLQHGAAPGKLPKIGEGKLQSRAAGGVGGSSARKKQQAQAQLQLSTFQTRSRPAGAQHSSASGSGPSYGTRGGRGGYDRGGAPRKNQTLPKLSTSAKKKREKQRVFSTQLRTGRSPAGSLNTSTW